MGGGGCDPFPLLLFLPPGVASSASCFVGVTVAAVAAALRALADSAIAIFFSWAACFCSCSAANRGVVFGSSGCMVEAT